MRKISILYLLLMWCGFVCAQESFGCWGSQDERAQSSLGETIVVCNESMSSGFQQGDWDQITSLEKVDDASVRCYYDKQAKRVVIETEDCLKVAFYTLGGTLLQKINGIAGGRNYFDLSPLNEKVVLIRIETGVPGKQKTYKIVME